MAGRLRGGVEGDVPQHPHGHRPEPDHHRPVLLPDKELHQPDICCLRLRRRLLEHQGNVRREEPADAFRVQRLGPVHEPDTLRGRAAAGSGGVRDEPLLLERLRGHGNTNYPAGRLPVGGSSGKGNAVRGWSVLVRHPTWIMLLET